MNEEIRELQQTLKSDPSNRQAFDALADQYAVDGDWRRLRWHYEKFSDHLDAEEDFSQLVFVLRELADAEENDREKSAILVALGDVLFEHRNNHDDGIAAYQSAFATYRDDTTSLDRARGIYRKNGDFERVLLVYDVECGVKKDSPALNDVLVRMAQVHGDFLGDRAEALSILSRVLNDVPDHEMAVLVQDIYQSGGTVEVAVKNKVREGHQAAQADEQNLAADALLEAAKLERFREGGGLRESAELAEQARSFAPDHLNARAFLTDIYEELEHDDALRHLSDSSDQDSSEIDAQDDASDPDPQTEAGATSDADPVDEQTLAADGGEVDHDNDESLATEGDELSDAEDGAQTEDTQESDQTNDDSSSAKTDDTPAEISDVEEAQKIFADDPADLAALAILRTHLRDQGSLEELAETLSKSLKYLRKKDGELGVMVELSNLYWKELGDAKNAEYYFKRIKLLDAEQPDMLAFYEDYYQQNNEWRKLFSLLNSRQRDTQNEEESLELSARLAQIAEVQMESPEKAIDVWKNFEREFDSHPQAREQLRRLYEENSKWNALVDFLKDRVRSLEEVAAQTGEQNNGAQVLLLERIADIYRDELGLDTMVINTLSAIMELEPDHRSAFEELKDKLAEGRRWNDLANLLHERAELMLAVDKRDDALDLFLQVADIWQESLRNVTQALPHLERVLEIQPDHAPVRARLAEIYEKRRDYESLFDLKFSAIDLTPVAEREARLEELLDLAEDRLRDPDRTVQVLEQLRAIRPDDAELVSKLEFIHRRRDDYARLADTLEDKAALAATSDDDAEQNATRSDALREAARLHESQNDDPESATRIWQSLLDEDAGDQEALGRLTDIYIHSQDLDPLQELYEKRDELEALCQLLTVAAEAETDDPRRAVLYRRIADIASDSLDDRELAVESLALLTQYVDDPREIARELDAHHEALGDLDGQIGAAYMLFDNAEDDEQRFDALCRLGRLTHKNDDPPGALEWFLQAATLRPGADAVLDEAEDVARQSASMGLFVEHVELIAQEAAEPKDHGDDAENAAICARLWQRIGRVLRDDQENYSGALIYFERLRERDPGDLKALDALEELYEQTEQPEKRIDALRDAIEILSSEGAERIDLVDQLAKIADVQRSHLDESDAARATYNEILDLEPNHLGALRGIRGLHRANQQWDDVVDSLRHEIGLLSLEASDARIRAQMELANALREHMDDPREAIHYYGQVLAEQPQHEGAVAAVEELLAEPTLAREAALMLEPIFRETDRFAQLARALEARRSISDDRFEEAEILDELIPIYQDKLDDTEQAFEHACRQFELDPGREEIWLRVEQLGAALNRWAQVEQVFSNHEKRSEEDPKIRRNINLLRHLAAIREYQLQKPEEALDAWEKVHAAEPTDTAVIDALERLYRQLSRQDELVDILEVRENLSDNDTTRIEILLEVALLSETALDDATRATEAYRRVLLLEEDHSEAVDALARLYRDAGAWLDLDELYVAQADLAMDPDRRRIFLLSLGQMRAEHLADSDGAADILSQLVREDPSDAPAVAALEALDASLQEQAIRKELRFDIARTLEPVYRNTEEFAKLAAVLETQQAHTHEAFEKVALLDELTGLYLDEIDNPSAGFDALQRAVLADPEDAARRTRLLNLAGDLDELDAAANTLEDAVLEVDTLSSPPIYRQLGGVYEDRLQQADRAIDAYERALEQDESDEDSLLALERLYQNTGRSEALAKNLRRQIPFADSARRIELLTRSATLYEDVLDRPDDAALAYHDLLQEEPDSTDAFDGLERVYGAGERWIDLADALRSRIDATYHDTERIAALERLADVHADRLGDRHEAVTIHREILGIDPQHHDSLDALIAFFEEDAQWHELAEALRQKIAATTPQVGEQFDALQLKLASVLREKLFDFDGALELYRAVLQRTSGHPEAVAALRELLEDENYAAQVTGDLVAHYSEHGEFEALIEVYESRAAQSYEPSEKAAFLEKAALLYADELQQPSRAIDALGEAWLLEPRRSDLHESLLDLCEASAADDNSNAAAPEDDKIQIWTRLSEIYEDVLAALNEPELRLNLHLALAKLFRDKLDDPPQVETHFRDVLAIDPRHEISYNALESLLIGQDRWIDFIELLERKFDVYVADDPNEASEILLRIAGVQEEQIDDGFSSVDTYRRVLDISESDPTATRALSRLYREQERWQDLCDHLRDGIALSHDGDEIVALKLTLGDTLREQMDQPVDALEVYRQVLNEREANPDAIAALEQLFQEVTQPDLRADIAQVIEPYYRKNEDAAQLVDVLLVRAEAASSGETAHSFLLEAAQIAESQLADWPRAAQILTQLFRSAPHDRHVRTQLHRLQTQLGNWEQFAELYSNVLANNFEVDDTLRVQLLCEQAAIFEERLQDFDRARRTYAEVLLFEVDNERAVDATERLLARTESWHDLAEFYRDRADAATDPMDSRRWLERLATLYEEILDELDEAIAVYGRIYDLEPGDSPIQQTLARLYGHAHRWHDLADLYRARIESSIDPQLTMELRFRLAGLLESDLDLIEDALQIYRKILDDNPDHPETLRALEGLQRDLSIRDDERAQYRPQVIDLLLEHYNEKNHWRRIADLLEQKQQLAADVDGQVSTLSEMAELIQRSASDEADRMRALVKLTRAFCIDPSNDYLRERVHERAEQLDAWERVIPIMLQGLETTDDPEIQSSLLIAIAEAYAGPLDDSASAITAYQQAVDINDDTRALGQLQRLYGDLELWEPLVQVLRRRLENEFDGETRGNLLKRIAMIYDEILNWPADATRAYEDLRAEDPGEITVLNALARLYRHAERWADLEDVLQASSEMVEDDQKRADLLVRLASVQDDKLDNSIDAISTYRAVIAEDPADKDAVRALSRLYEGSQNWPELLDNLDLEAGFADQDDHDALNAVDMRRAIVLMDKLHAPHDALAPLRRILERDPANLDAREALRELLDVPETRREAAQTLQKIYREAEEFETLKNLYEQQLDYLDDRDLRAEVFMDLAGLHEDQFGSTQMAFMTLGRAFGELPDVEFIRRDLERLSLSLDNPDELAATYEDTLESAILDPDAELSLRQRAGEIYAEQLQDFPAAITHFEAALRIDEYDRNALDALDRLYQQANRWDELAEVLQIRLAVSDPDQLNDVRFRLAYLREVVFEQYQEALELYRPIILEEPEHRGALEGLGRMTGVPELLREICELLEPSYESLEAHEALAELYELKLDVADSSAERAELYRRIAQLQVDELENIYSGYAYLGRALREDPHDIDVQSRLESLADEHDLQDQLVALYEDIVDTLDDPVRLCELALHAGENALNVLDEPKRARRLYKMVLDIEPENAQALNALETIARQQDDPQALELVLQRKVESLFEPDTRKKALLELGEVRMRLELFDEAIQSYNEALTLDESDLEVLHQLVALYEITEQYNDLVGTLERLAGYIKDVDEKRLLYVRIGQYTRHFIDAPERSIDAYRNADAIDPGRPNVLLALEGLYEKTEQWPQFLDTVERQLEALDADSTNEEDGESGEHLRLYVQRARVNYAQFNQIEDAIEDYQRAFAIQKDSPLVVEALDELYRSEARWEDLMELYTEQLQFVSDEARLLELHIEMADINRAHLDDEARALELLDMVLEIQPGQPRALDVLQSIHAQRGDWTQVADVLARKTEHAGDEDKIALIVERAELLENQLSDSTAAAQAYVDVLEVDPTHAGALTKLKAIYEANDDYGQLHAILEHESMVAESEDARIALLLEMADIAGDKLDAPTLRIDALEKAYAARPDDLDIVEPLLDAYISSDDFASAEPLLNEIIETLHADRRMAEVVRFEHLKGKLAEQKGDLDAAKLAYESAHKVDATYVPNLLSLGKLLVTTEEWDGALKIFQTLLLHQMSINDSQQKVDLYYYLGRVRLQKGDARRAKDMFNRALGIDSEHAPSQQSLAEL